MVDVCWSAEGRLAPSARLAVRPDPARSGRGGAALRAGDLRGHQGLPPRRRLDLDVPAVRERPPHAALGAPARAARAAGEYFLESLRQLIAVDGAWVPTGADQSLYLRPFMFAKEAFLGVRPAKKVAYYLIASPAGAYFHGGVQPVSIWLSEKYARAGKGGTGAAKTGGNYASSLLPQAEAYEHGCQQVVFLDEDRNLEELGGMNVRARLQGRHARDPAVRRRSSRASRATRCCSSPRTAATRSRAAAITLDEWRTARHPATSSTRSRAAPPPWSRPSACSGRGLPRRAAVGELALSLREELTDIQYGRVEDRHGWLIRLDA